MAYRRKDAFYTRAKAAGYRSRAAYKLLELARRHRLIRPGDRVVDLGAWPGAWLQVAAELTGRRGTVVGIDLQPIDALAGVSTLVGDVRDAAVQDEIRRRLGGRADVVLSDLSPKLSGVRDRDAARAAELAGAALEIADRMMARGGHLVIKIFMSAETEALLVELRRRFRAVRVTQAEATRKGSSEHYAVALDFSPPAPSPP